MTTQTARNVSDDANLSISKRTFQQSRNTSVDTVEGENRVVTFTNIVSSDDLLPEDKISLRSNFNSESTDTMMETSSSASSDVFYHNFSALSESAKDNTLLTDHQPVPENRNTDHVGCDTGALGVDKLHPIVESSSSPVLSASKIRSYSTCDIPSSTQSKDNVLGKRTRGSFHNALAQTTKFWSTIRRGSRSAPTTPQKSSLSTPVWNNTNSKFSEDSKMNKSSSSKSFYKSYEDLIFSNPTISQRKERSLTSESLSGLTVAYHGEIWSEIGYSGGVIQVPGTDVSMHVGANEQKQQGAQCICKGSANGKSSRDRSLSKTYPFVGDRCSRKSKLRLVTPASIKDFACSGTEKFDGRIIVSLADPPDLQVLAEDANAISVKNIAHAGPAVRMDFVDEKLRMHEVVIQSTISTKISDLDKTKSSHEKKELAGHGVSEFCEVVCLQSKSIAGPFQEVQKCFQYGNTLQATLDMRHVERSDKHQLHLVPIVKVFGTNDSSPWDFVTCNSLNVGVYGPCNTYNTTICCISISTVEFSPPFLILPQDFCTNRTLRRWDTYSVPINRMQGLELTLQTASGSALSVDSDTATRIIQEDKLNESSRINSMFVLHRSQHDNRDTAASETACRTIIIKVTGLRDKLVRKMQCKTAPLTDLKLPSTILPVVARRLENMVEISAAASVDNDWKDCAFQWDLFQHKAKSQLKRSINVSRAERKLCTPLVAVALKNRSEKHKWSFSNPNFHHYDRGDYMAILSSRTLTLRENDEECECWIAYSEHETGLVPADCVQTLSFEEFCCWDKARPTVRNVIEAIVEPVQHLNCSNLKLRRKVIEKVEDWYCLSEIINFGSDFVQAATSIGVSPSQRSEMLNYFLEKYEHYCSSGPYRRSFHQEIIKALLYAEEYSVVIDLIVDFCLLSVALVILNHWTTLASRQTEELGAHAQELLESKCHNKQEPWMPALQFLERWRNSTVDDNHFLHLLREELESMSNFPRKTLFYLTDAIVLVLSIQSLSCFDTRL